MVSASRKIARYLWSKKSTDITIFPSVEHLLDDIAARYEAIVRESLRSLDIPLKDANIDIQRLKFQSLDADIFLGCIHLRSIVDTQVAHWQQIIPELEKKIHKRLRADGLLGYCRFTELWWLGSRDKYTLVCLQANQPGQAA